MIETACTLLVDPAGAVLLQLRDDHAPYHPNVWGLPGGAVEPGETADVVLGEGAAMLFIPPSELLGRPFTPGTAEVLERFLASPEYRSLRP